MTTIRRSALNGIRRGRESTHALPPVGAAIGLVGIAIPVVGGRWGGI